MTNPKVEPLGYDLTRDMVREVWDVFIVPTQDDWAGPQSAETRVLMSILRFAYTQLPPTDSEPDEDYGEF